MKVSTPYTEGFFEKQSIEARRSAEQVVPLILQLVHPTCVVDVGCGLGVWLAALRKKGITDVLGVDGDYIDRRMLQIPLDQFMTADLTQPFHIDRKFDLVISLEVAEHLPQDIAESFVHSLVTLGPIVLFSAAVPFQQGTHHINEQWPDYWKGYFEREGYVAVDALRKRIWKNERVEFWYRQNMLIYVRKEYLVSNERLQQAYEETNVEQLSLVHPELYLSNLRSLAKTSRTPSLSEVLRLLPTLMKNSAKRRVRQFFKRHR